LSQLIVNGVTLAAYATMTPASPIVVALFNVALIITVNLVYYTWMTAAGGQTLGKKLFKLRVVRADGTPMDMAHAFGRAVGYWISTVPLLLGYLIVPFTPRKRALHDFVADSCVVQTAPSGGFVSALIWIIPIVSCLLAVFAAAIMAAKAGTRLTI
jgi:uncharacterized RDD family membrane protein YckC